MQRIARPALVLILFVVCAGLLPSGAHPQSLEVARAGISRPLDVAESAASRRGPSSATATLASAILPGAGQALLRSGRAFIYAGIEALGWVRYSRQQRDGDRFRSRYRELSRTVARAAFNPSGPDGDWDYYERMEKFAASGAYDRVPGGDVDPEPDPSTYNGSIWLLARQTYWRDPDTSPLHLRPSFNRPWRSMQSERFRRTCDGRGWEPPKDFSSTGVPSPPATLPSSALSKQRD